MEGTPLFSFWGADSSSLSGSWWLKFLLVWRFQGPELFWSTEHQFSSPPTPILDQLGPSPGEGWKLSPALGGQPAKPGRGRAAGLRGERRAGECGLWFGNTCEAAVRVPSGLFWLEDQGEGRGRHRPGLGTSTSTVISCRCTLQLVGGECCSRRAWGAGCWGWLLPPLTSSPESFRKCTALRLVAVGEGWVRHPFRIAFALKLRWSVEHPLRGRWGGVPPSCSPPPSPISERPGQPAPSPAPHRILPLSPSLLETLPPSTRHSSCRPGGGGLDTAALDLFSSRAGEGGGGVGSLVLGWGPCWQRPQADPSSSSPPNPGGTSNHIFLLHTHLTRSGSETSHRPPHPLKYICSGPTELAGGPGLGRGETWAQRKRAEARCAGQRVHRPLKALGTGRWSSPGSKPGSLWFLPISGPQAPLHFLKHGLFLAALCLGTLGPSCP